VGRASALGGHDVDVRRTRRHYEEFPFLQGGAARVGTWVERSGRFLDDDVVVGARVLDIGSSTGEVALALEARGASVVCLDLTTTALTVARRQHGIERVCQADACRLPFRDGCFDVALAVGVLHHTPDCRRGLEEAARVTRPDGRVVVMLYRRWTPYHALYLLIAPIRRRVDVAWLRRTPSWLLRGLRPLLQFQVRQPLDDEQIRRLIADQLWTPRASFHSRRQVFRWADRCGLDPVLHRPVPLYGDWMVFRRVSTAV
jgi:SAM-dependent methyltransferase